jgi:hypothetical protein
VAKRLEPWAQIWERVLKGFKKAIKDDGSAKDAESKADDQ